MSRTTGSTTGPRQPVTSPPRVSDQRVVGPRFASVCGRALRPHLAAVILIAVGLAYRVYLLIREVPPTNSDEATMGLAAMHIAEGSDFPIFFYGQAYMGTADAYLAVPLIWLFGPSTTALRIPMLALYLAFAIGVYQLTRTVYSRGLAVFTVAVLAFGSDRLIKNQLIAGGGYPEISPAAVWLLVLSVWLAADRRRVRPLPLAGWGFIVGFLLWDDWLILPYVAAAGVLLFAACWPRLRAGNGRIFLPLALTGGLVVGATPLIVHHIVRPLSENSISVFLSLSGSAAPASVTDHLYGGLLIGIPMASGVCSPSSCTPWQQWWGVAYLVLLALATVLAIMQLRRARHALPTRSVDRVGAVGNADGVDERIVALARLALLGAAVLSILSYVRSGAAAHTPIESARYLSATLISLPAVLWPLWMALTTGAGRRAETATRVAGRRVSAATAVAVLAGFLALAATASVTLVRTAPEYAQQASQRRQLVSTLLDQGVRHVYTEYWTCDAIALASEESIVCAVLSDSLGPGLDRYRPYRAKVASSDAPVYVVPESHVLKDRLEEWLRSTGVAYRVTDVAGYRVFHPSTTLHPPR